MTLEAVVVHSDLERTGTFECSNELVNQLHRNIVWGLRGNFLDLPTDCPQRDERLGWTGDIAVFAPTAAFLYDVKGFLQDWLLDLAAEQKAAGRAGPHHRARTSLKYCPQPPEFPAPGVLRAVERGVRLGALGAVGGLRRPRRAARTSTTRWPRTPAGWKACSRPTGLWDSGLPVRRLARSRRRAGPAVGSQGGHRRRGHRLPVPDRQDHRPRRADCWASTDDEAYFDALAARVQNAFAEHYVAADGTIPATAPPSTRWPSPSTSC